MSGFWLGFLFGGVSVAGDPRYRLHHREEAAVKPNGSEILHPHGGRRLTVQGVGLVELVFDEHGNVHHVITEEPLDPEKQQRLALWLEHEWPKRTS